MKKKVNYCLCVGDSGHVYANSVTKFECNGRMNYIFRQHGKMVVLTNDNELTFWFESFDEEKQVTTKYYYWKA